MAELGNNYFSGLQTYDDKTKEELYNEYFKIDKEIEEEKAKHKQILFTLETNQNTIKNLINNII